MTLCVLPAIDAIEGSRETYDVHADRAAVHAAEVHLALYR